MSSVFQILKILKVAVLPLFWAAIAIGILGVVLVRGLASRRVALARLSWFCCFFVVVILGNPVVSDLLLGALEQAHPPARLETGNWDAVIVLTGEVREAGTGRPRDEFEPLGLVRLVCGAEAFQRARASKLIFSGSPSAPRPGDRYGISQVRDLAARLGVPEKAILLETASRNTTENARASAGMLGPGARVLVVTSAYHMPRTLLAFRKTGIDAAPYACDYRIRQRIGSLDPYDFRHLAPDVESLERSTHAVIEYLGMLAEWLRP